MSPDAPPHGAIQSALLHLAPGAIALAGLVLVGAPLARILSLPPKMGFVIMDVLVLIPLLVGILWAAGRHANRRWSLDGIVLNRQPIRGGELTLTLLAIAAWGALVMFILPVMDDMLLHRFFFWVPESLLTAGRVDETGYTPAVLIGTRVAGVVVVGIVGPIAEELYFRGFLLPRVSWMGPGAAIWQSVLFAAYHLWSPWQVVTRALVLIPMVYAVQRKRSLAIGVWGHCLGNTAGELLALGAVVRAVMRS